MSDTVPQSQPSDWTPPVYSECVCAHVHYMKLFSVPGPCLQHLTCAAELMAGLYVGCIWNRKPAFSRNIPVRF